MTPIKYRTYFILLGICNVLFVLLFGMLSYYNRLAADDLYYLGNYSEIGAWGCMSELYRNYSGRWLAYLLTGGVISLNHFKGYHFIFNCFTFLCLITILYHLIDKIISVKFNSKPSAKITWLFAILLTANLFFTSYGIGETWFWLVQVCTYLWSIIMSLVLLYTLIDKQLKYSQLLLIVPSSLFIGGASESYALIILFMLLSYLFLTNIRINGYPMLVAAKNKSRNTKISIALVCILIAFAITLYAPGNAVRYHALPKGTGGHLILVQLKSFIKISCIKMPLNFPYLILFSFPWLIYGSLLGKEAKKVGCLPFVQKYKQYFFIAITLVFIFLLPTSFIMVELGPDRSLSQVSFFIACCCSALFFMAGVKLKISNKIISSLKAAFIAATIALLIYHLINQYKLTSTYAVALDNRIKQLNTLQANGQRKVTALEPLPAAGMLYSAEITKDTTHFSNQFLKKALHLNFQIKKGTE